MSLLQTFVLICLATANAADDIGVKPKKFLTAGEHQQITAAYSDRNQERQLRDLTGLWDSFIARNGKLSHLPNRVGDEHLFSNVLRESISNSSTDPANSESDSIKAQLRFISDELVDCYRYYRDFKYAISSFYRKGAHNYPVTSLEMGRQSEVVSSYSMGPMEEEAARFRNDLVQLCGKKAVDRLDASFVKSGWYIPKK